MHRPSKLSMYPTLHTAVKLSVYLGTPELIDAVVVILQEYNKR